MSESTLNKSFSELYKDVLEYQGAGRDSTDAAKIAKAKRRVNDAYRKFLALDWGFLIKQATLKVDAEKDTYELPDDYAVIKTPFKCFPNTSFVNPTEETISRIWEYQMYYPQNGVPIHYTFSNSYDVKVGVRCNVIFYPVPSQTIEYKYEYKIFTNILTEDTDIPCCPANISHVLAEFCLTEVEMFDEDGEKTTHTNNLYNVLLPQAIRENAIRKPNTVGTFGPQFGSTINGNVGIVNGIRFKY